MLYIYRDITAAIECHTLSSLENVFNSDFLGIKLFAFLRSTSYISMLNLHIM